MYYLISFTYNCALYYCIWFSDAEDYVLANEGRLIYFNTIEAVMDYVSRKKILFETEDVTEYNIDNLLKWCNDSSNLNIVCDTILNFWNIFTDVAKGVKKNFIGDHEKYNELYKKIFYGNNLINESVKQYVPSFSKQEVWDIKTILVDGVNIVTEYFD